MSWQFVLTGLLIGALVGMTGMGGGSLMTPILIIFFGFKPTLAVGTDLLHGAIFKSFGAVRHRQLGTVNARLAAWMFLGSARRRCSACRSRRNWSGSTARGWPPPRARRSAWR